MKQVLTIAMLFALIFLMHGCKQTDRDIINDTFPEVQEEITKVLDEIYKSAQLKDFDRLSAFHAYSPKFTEFKNGEPRADSEMNERSERDLFAALSDFEYELRDLKVSVYGEVAIATFHGNFEAIMGDQQLSFRLQSTLIFAKTGDTWKIIHEHFSPLNLTEQD